MLLLLKQEKNVQQLTLVLCETLTKFELNSCVFFRFFFKALINVV